MKSSAEASDYTFEEAYDIRDKGIGTLNLAKAAKSVAFKKKASKLANSIKNMHISIKSNKSN